MKHRQKVLNLRPTQFAVGMLEVEEKIEMVRKFDQRELRSFINDNPVPVVLGPDKNLYICDHHHFLVVCYHLGIKKIRIEIVRDLSRRKLSFAQFWRWMFKSRKAYPYCQFGEGPRKAIYLPKDIRGLADDPYRSLAWFVRKAGAFKNSEKNFAEFQWANFFRSRRLLDRYGLEGDAQCVEKGRGPLSITSGKRIAWIWKTQSAGEEQGSRKGKEKSSRVGATMIGMVGES